MNCPNCGKEIIQGSMYCPSCGTAVGSAQPAPPPPPVTGQQGTSGPTQTPTPPTAPGSQQQGQDAGYQGAAGGVNPPPPGGAQQSFQPPPVPPPPGTPGGQVPPPPGTPYQNVLKNSPLCIAALVLGIASLLFIFGPILGTILGIAGIILGKIGMDQVDENPGLYTGRNMGQVGMVLSIIAVVLNVLLTIARYTIWSTRIFW